ncbi:uncharacterized protein LOC105213294 isoform X3 [Zeugodacus cucurbitae]|uniref:uncharacterized protein LOC105213294 isoform X3 n=1 Tax=Zeugodacus cucurbitae TaxID=28588 RepID=UPI0023D9168F|nr:uncharacterized protein LOC105213294 isoform X3 [Zeugodacus cucurbitae]
MESSNYGYTSIYTYAFTYTFINKNRSTVKTTDYGDTIVPKPTNYESIMNMKQMAERERERGEELLMVTIASYIYYISHNIIYVIKSAESSSISKRASGGCTVLDSCMCNFFILHLINYYWDPDFMTII